MPCLPNYTHLPLAARSTHFSRLRPYFSLISRSIVRPSGRGDPVQEATYRRREGGSDCAHGLLADRGRGGDANDAGLFKSQENRNIPTSERQYLIQNSTVRPMLLHLQIIDAN